MYFTHKTLLDLPIWNQKYQNIIKMYAIISISSQKDEQSLSCFMKNKNIA